MRADIELVFTFPPIGDRQDTVRTVDIGHGRIEQRNITTSAALVGYSDWPGLAQVFELGRHVLIQKTGEERVEVVYGVTSLSPARATPGRLLALVRGQWQIENQSHWVRDVTFDEDRSQVRCGNIPPSHGRVSNTTIGLLRWAGYTNIAAACRLNEAREAQIPWKKWGPYLSERQWGTVREDYSDNGDAWNYFTHDQARSRAYRWGEDGLGGLCDDKQRLCFALALWNERDPILKERLFGLTNSEANHGEDVKEYYFYLDSTPTHSYMKYLYKYPQREYPYRDLIETNRRRSREEFEYELLDTGIFNDDRYFDVFVEYAKEGPEDILIRMTVHNRGPEAARLRLLPTLWFRNTWSWGEDERKPSLREVGPGVMQATHPELGDYWLYCDGAPELLFTENESNAQRLWGQPNTSPYVKDAFHQYIIAGRSEAVNPAKTGTKAAAHYVLEVPGGGSQTVRLRLATAEINNAFGGFDDDLHKPHRRR